MLAYVCFIHFITFANMKLANIAKLATAGVGLSTLAMNTASAAIKFQGASGSTYGQAIDSDLKGDEATTLPTIIQNYVNYFIGFSAMVAVIYGVYGGFIYLTAGGNDEQTKKAKTIFKQVAIGLIVIFLAYSVVAFVMSSLETSAKT